MKRELIRKLAAEKNHWAAIGVFEQIREAACYHTFLAGESFTQIAYDRRMDRWDPMRVEQAVRTVTARREKGRR